MNTPVENINKELIECDKGKINGCRHYDTVRLQMGYNKDAPQLIVKCGEIWIAQDATIPEEDLGPQDLWFVISLGEILHRKNC